MFEMFVLGVPRSPEAASVEEWKAVVRAAAWEQWPYLEPAPNTEVSAVVVYFYRDDTLLDVDNMAKPILDALKGIAYADDRLVSQLTARKTKLAGGLEITDPSPVLARAIEKARSERSDLVYVKIYDPPNHGHIP